MLQTSRISDSELTQEIRESLKNTLSIYQDKNEGTYYIPETGDEEKELENNRELTQIPICEGCACGGRYISYATDEPIYIEGKSYQVCDGCLEWYNSANEDEIKNWAIEMN